VGKLKTIGTWASRKNFKNLIGGEDNQFGTVCGGERVRKKMGRK